MFEKTKNTFKAIKEAANLNKETLLFANKELQSLMIAKGFEFSLYNHFKGLGYTQIINKDIDSKILDTQKTVSNFLQDAKKQFFNLSQLHLDILESYYNIEKLLLECKKRKITTFELVFSHKKFKVFRKKTLEDVEINLNEIRELIKQREGKNV